jgi:RimJ/RimL family protein N-acetyltransferase/ubiquinone/menaquinone biosynthesis C-methylase UbiE
MIETSRLYIKPLSYEQLIKYAKCDKSLENELNLESASRSVSPDLEDALEKIILPAVADGSKNYLFSTLWTAISKTENTMVGDICFYGEPNSQGEVEIGYGIYEAFQNQGYMTEIVRGMIDWAKLQPGVKAIIASTDKTNRASFKVLQKNNFKKVSETEELFNWKLALDPPGILPSKRLSFSKSFGASYDDFMYLLEKLYLKKRRARLISNLSGIVLEVGVGTGVNFEHYGNDIQLTGIEPSPHMMEYAQKRREILLFPNKITLHSIGCGYPEMEQLIHPESLDAVVCTLVLCTIPEPQKALNNYMKWLKPGGKLVILEHIKSHNRIPGKLQDVFNPLWSKMAEGCQLNRPTDKLLAQSGFQLLREERFTVFLPFYEAEYVKPDVTNK